jgi:hypothetical protein
MGLVPLVIAVGAALAISWESQRYPLWPWETPSQIERVAHQYFSAHGYHDIAGVSCDQRGDAVAVRGTTSSAYACTIHGGRNDGAMIAAFWDGHRVTVDCSGLPGRALNAVCFD